MNTLGPSSYGDGDKQGSHGDYMHGVSQGWIEKKVGAAAGKASHERTTSFIQKMRGSKSSGLHARKRWVASNEATALRRPKPGSENHPAHLRGMKGKSAEQKSGWAAWKAKGGGKK